MEASASTVDRHEEGSRKRSYFEVGRAGSKIRAGHYRTVIRGSIHNNALSRNQLAVG